MRFMALQRPGVDDRRARLLVQEDDVQDIEWVDRDDAGNEGFLRLPIEGLAGETAGVDFATLIDEFCDALVDEQVAGKRLVPERREAALKAERHAWPVE